MRNIEAFEIHKTMVSQTGKNNAGCIHDIFIHFHHPAHDMFGIFFWAPRAIKGKHSRSLWGPALGLGAQRPLPGVPKKKGLPGMVRWSYGVDHPRLGHMDTKAIWKAKKKKRLRLFKQVQRYNNNSGKRFSMENPHEVYGYPHDELKPIYQSTCVQSTLTVRRSMV